MIGHCLESTFMIVYNHFSFKCASSERREIFTFKSKTYLKSAIFSYNLLDKVLTHK